MPNKTKTNSSDEKEPDRIKATQIHQALTGLLNAPVALAITDNHHSIITVKRRPSGFALRLHRIFLEATEAVLTALARWAAGPRKRANQTLRAFIDQNQSRIDNPARLKKPRKTRLLPKGRHFDLREVLQRLQQEYFAADLHLQITWGTVRKKPSRRHIRLGSYAAQNKLIRINPLLDQEFVPVYVVDDIVFHEILHHYLGNQTRDGRNLTHHAAFKKLEKEFRHHQAAKTWIKENLPRLVRQKGNKSAD